MTEQEELERYRYLQLKAKVAKSPTIAERAVSAVRSAVPSTKSQVESPLGVVRGQFGTAKKVFEAGGYQKSLPMAGQVVGEVLGAVGGGPAGAVGGAAIGQALGKAGEQYFDTIEGKKPKSLKEQYIEQAGAGAEGATMAMGGQMLSRGALKAAQVIPASKDFMKFGKNVREGFNNYLERLDTVLSPKGPLVREELIGKFGEKQASNISDAKAFIENKFGEKGFTQPLQRRGIEGATSGRMKVSPEVLQKALQETGQSAEALEIQKLTSEVRGGKVSSSKPYVKPKKYQTMGDIAEGLNDPNLKYKDILEMKKVAGDNANFGAKDFDRTQEQKDFGQLYHLLEEDAARTAKEGKFAFAHKRIKTEGQAYNRKKFLKDILETNKTDKPGAKSKRYYSTGEQANYPGIAYDIMGYTDDQLGRVFGMKTNDIRTLRQLASEFGARTSGKSELEEMGRAFITSGGRPGAVIHPVTPLKRRIGIENSIDQILTDRGFEGSEKTMLKSILYGKLKSKPIESVSGLGKELDRVLSNSAIQGAIKSMRKNK